MAGHVPESNALVGGFMHVRLDSLISLKWNGLYSLLVIDAYEFGILP